MVAFFLVRSVLSTANFGDDIPNAWHNTFCGGNCFLQCTVRRAGEEYFFCGVRVLSPRGGGSVLVTSLHPRPAPGWAEVVRTDLTLAYHCLPSPPPTHSSIFPHCTPRPAPPCPAAPSILAPRPSRHPPLIDTIRHAERGGWRGQGHRLVLN